MRKSNVLILMILLFGALSVTAQNSRYIIKLKNKSDNPFSIGNPIQFLSQQAIDRRTRYSIPIDSTDLPIIPRYIDSIRLAGDVSILNVSKWLNQVAIRTTDAAAISKINSFPFVLSTSPIGSFSNSAGERVNKKLDATSINYGPVADDNSSFVESTDYYNYGKSNGQVKLHHGEFLHNHGFHGENMQIAMLDAGFYHYLTLPTFDSIRANNQILGTWDFVDNEMSVNEDFEHGMECLSTISANLPGTFIGTAPKASFYLYRTEDVNSEYPIEEQNWVAAVERADSLGVPVSSTSLGYNIFDDPTLSYTYSDLDGNTTISAKGADFAARKGMLLVIAAGNTGNDPTWNRLLTPSDADSVLSVGAVDTIGTVATFSAYGPSSDGQVKPAVAAVGLNAYVANPSSGLPVTGNGTSFACPNMAGLITCLWQAFPEINNMGVIDAVEKSASRANAPDNRIGYGIPDMKSAFVIMIKKLFSQHGSINNCKALLSFSIKAGKNMPLDLQRKASGETQFTTLTTFTANDTFSNNTISYADDLSQNQLGTVQYRLRMSIDADTSFELDPITLNYSESCTPVTNKVTVGPNPTSGNLYINIERTSIAKIGILLNNAVGQTVYKNEVVASPGYSIQTVPMQKLSGGIYFVTVLVDGNKLLTQKILH